MTGPTEVEQVRTMALRIPLYVEAEVTDADLLRAAASFDALDAGGGPYEQLSVAQAFLAMLERRLPAFPGLRAVTVGEDGGWDALAGSHDPVLPVPHVARYHEQRGNVWSVGWECACGAGESPRYALGTFAEEAHAEHVRQVEGARP